MTIIYNIMTSSQVKMLKFLILLILLPVVVFLYLRWLERASVWQPRRDWVALPNVVGLKHEDVYFKTADGLTLSGWYIPAEEPVATLLFCHGNGGNISHRTESLRQLNLLRFNIFIFDYRGYGKSEGSLSEEGTYLDAVAAYQWLKQRDPSLPFVIFGRSLGGSIAIDLASKAQADAVICESAFTCVPDMAARVFSFLPVRSICVIGYDTLAKIKKVQAPILIIHSQADEIVPYEMSKRLFEAANEPKYFLEIEGRHNEGYILSEENYLQKIGEFVKKHILRGEAEMEKL